MNDYKMTPVCSYNAIVKPFVVSAPPGDLRINFWVESGAVEGPKIQGKVRPVGADWLTLRGDGVCVLDVRTEFVTHDEATIDVIYNGIIDLGADGYNAFLRGEIPDLVKIFSAPRLRTADQRYAWVNRTQFVNIGQGKLRENYVSYDMYALS